VIDPDEVAPALDSVAAEILAAAGIEEPPVDSDALARHLGLVVEEVASPGRSRSNPSAVRVDPDWPAERRHFTIAQAVGKMLKPRLVAKLGEMGASASLLNRLGERLLVPTEWFAADARATGYDWFALKERYRTAPDELLAGRLLEVGESVVVAFLDGDRVLWRRGNGVRANRRLTAAEERCLGAVRASGSPEVVRSENWTVQGWPLSSEGRVVLFSRVED